MILFSQIQKNDFFSTKTYILQTHIKKLTFTVEFTVKEVVCNFVNYDFFKNY